jgi:hypothetical protein
MLISRMIRAKKKDIPAQRNQKLAPEQHPIKREWPLALSQKVFL